ncbi:MAG: MMPL family transporter [Tenericutes bacterium]|nr:MMPL family transporter [Mycoplasmatota bacterium]
MNKPLKTTIYKLAPAVLISLVATSLGLLSLFKSKVPMIQDFGMMLTIGIVIAFLLALFVLLPILVVRTKLSDKSDKLVTKKATSKYFLVMKKFTKGVLKFKYVIIIVAFILAGIGFFFDQKVGVETDMETFMPQDSEALADIHELRDLVGSTDAIVLMYQSDEIDSYATIFEVKTISDMLNTEYSDSIVRLGSVTTMLDMLSNSAWNEANFETFYNQLPSEQLALLQSSEENIGIINVSLANMDDAEFVQFLDDLSVSLDNLDMNMEITVTGQSIVEQEMLVAMTSDRLIISLISIALVFGALLLIYRNLFKALIAILPIVFIIGWSGGIMYLLGFDYTPLTSTIGALIIGIGTEFTILILMRYYELKKETGNHLESISDAIGHMSKPIIVSGITTIGGFSALVFSDFQILSNFGIMTLINISLALISSIVVLPALLGILGKSAKVVASN